MVRGPRCLDECRASVEPTRMNDVGSESGLSALSMLQNATVAKSDTHFRAETLVRQLSQVRFTTRTPSCGRQTKYRHRSFDHTYSKI
jgi:hypothetical protein